jgi:co-chaperonin GroES (HSP10)
MTELSNIKKGYIVLIEEVVKPEEGVLVASNAKDKKFWKDTTGKRVIVKLDHATVIDTEDDRMLILPKEDVLCIIEKE